ncbi:mycofactocin system transcriptional regulator [Streptomyces sp. alain-838]|nr:TetR family transcriptional regulator [Streptomyces sp. alain-838]PAK25686.1 mycofactocin system transcriptional regulator [Streptomyces sp. alain-838]
MELIALRLFSERGFEETTVDDITAEAGVNRRTFFRYFDSKVSVLWYGFDQEVDRLRAALRRVPQDVPLMDAIRRAVIEANRTRAGDETELRARLLLLTGAQALAASAAPRYEAWGRTISDYAGVRLGLPADALEPLAIGRTTVAACRAAFDCWLAAPGSDLTRWLDDALRALAAGFAR